MSDVELLRLSELIHLNLLVQCQARGQQPINVNMSNSSCCCCPMPTFPGVALQPVLLLRDTAPIVIHSRKISFFGIPAEISRYI